MGYYIKQNPTGVIYSEAVDVESAPYTYEETDELIVLSAEEKEAFEKEQEEKKRTVLSLLIGILALACGIFAVVKPETVAQYFPILAGLLVLSTGILRSAETIVHRKEFAAWKPVLAVSVATIVLGAILLFCSFDQQTTVRILGTVMLYLGATGAVETGGEKK